MRQIRWAFAFVLFAAAAAIAGQSPESRRPGGKLIFESDSVAAFLVKCESSGISFDLVFKWKRPEDDVSVFNPEIRALVRDTLHPLLRKQCPSDGILAFNGYLAGVFLGQDMSESSSPLGRLEQPLYEVMVRPAQWDWPVQREGSFVAPRSLADVRQVRERVNIANAAARAAEESKNRARAEAERLARKSVPMPSSIQQFQGVRRMSVAIAYSYGTPDDLATLLRLITSKLAEARIETVAAGPGVPAVVFQLQLLDVRKGIINEGITYVAQLQVDRDLVLPRPGAEPLTINATTWRRVNQGVGPTMTALALSMRSLLDMLKELIDDIQRSRD